MCLYPSFVRVNGSVQMVRCGKCIECKKERQNDVAHRLWLASLEEPNIHFFTLTYSNEKCPFYIKATEWFLEEHGYLQSYQIPFRRDAEIDETLAYRLVYDYDDEPEYYIVDKYTDTTVSYGSGTFDLLGLYDTDLDYVWFDKVRRDYWRLQKDDDCCPIPAHHLTFPTQEEYVGDFTITPSLRNTDVTKWLRSFRKQDGKHKSFDFKYYFCGEYGPQTSRPHYHMITFGLTDSQAEYMRLRWVKWYGDPDNDYGTTVSRVNPGEHASKAALYVAKYVSKGTFESCNVKNNFVVRPRGVSSRSMYQMTKEMFEWYSGKDIFNDDVRRYMKSLDYRLLPTRKQDWLLDNGIWRFLPEEYYTDEKLSILQERQYFILNGDGDHKYKIGRTIKNKIFKYKKYDEIQCKERILSTPLSLALSQFVRDCATQNLLDKYRQLRQESPELSRYEVTCKFNDVNRMANKERGEFIQETYKKFLRKSPF